MVIFHSYVKLPEGTLYIEDIGIHLFGLVGGFNPFEKYEFVSWDDEIPNIWKNQSHVPNHQPVEKMRKSIQN